MKQVKLTLTMAACVAFLAVSAAQAGTAYVDLGAAQGELTAAGVAANWNAAPALADYRVAESISLTDTDGNAMGVTMSYEGFNSGHNTDCLWSGGAHVTATGDAAPFDLKSNFGLYGNTGDWGGTTNPTCYVTLSGLTAGNTYDLVLFANRSSVTDARIANYSIVDGAGTTTLTLNASSNTTNVVSAMGLIADANGEINLTMTKDDSSGTSQFFYLSSLSVTENAVPEPASMSLLGLGGLAALLRRRRK